MSRHYDLTKPPKFILNILSNFRKWKLKTYKKKKVRKEKSLKNRIYFVKFTIKMDDSINPQECEKEYEMFIPAKAAFFAKKKTLEEIKSKIKLNFIDCEIVSDEEYEALEKNKEQYIKEKNI